MEQFVGYIVKNLVDSPESVSAIRRASDQEVVIEVRVAPDEVGKVIGRKGKTIQAVRTLTSTAAARLGCRVRVEVVDGDTDNEVTEDNSSAEEDAVEVAE